MFRSTMIAIVIALSFLRAAIVGAQDRLVIPSRSGARGTDARGSRANGAREQPHASAGVVRNRRRARAVRRRRGFFRTRPWAIRAPRSAVARSIAAASTECSSSRPIPLGGKLGLSREIFNREVTQAEALRDVQRQRVLTDVRMLYYEALAAERRVEVRQNLAALGGEAVAVTRQLFNTGAADRPDVLASEIEARQLQVAFETAQNDRYRVWHRLAALVGDSSLTPRPLDGSIDSPIPELQRDTIVQDILKREPRAAGGPRGDRTRAGGAHPRRTRASARSHCSRLGTVQPRTPGNQRSSSGVGSGRGCRFHDSPVQQESGRGGRELAPASDARRRS